MVVLGDLDFVILLGLNKLYPLHIDRCILLRFVLTINKKLLEHFGKQYFFHTRPLTLIFSDRDMNDSCYQLMTAVNQLLTAVPTLVSSSAS